MNFNFSKSKIFVGFTISIFLSLIIFVNSANSSQLQQNKVTNVLGTALKSCCFNPLTGFYRDGFCHTGANDYGSHTVCAIMTKEFLEFTKSQGNDLSTPKPQFNFPGLKAGDKWCLCSVRWLEAYKNGKASMVELEASHKNALDIIPMEYLKEKAIIKH